MLLTSNRLLRSSAGLLVTQPAAAFGTTTPWQAHYNRVRAVGGAAAAATVDMAFVEAFFRQMVTLSLNVLADLSPRFGYMLDAASRVVRLFEPLGKDLEVPPNYQGPTVTQANGHVVLVFDGNSVLVAGSEQDFDLLTGDLVSYTYSNSLDTSNTTTLYSKTIASASNYRYALIYDGGQLYSLYVDTLAYLASVSAMPPGVWRELGQRVQRQVASNELLVARQVVATQQFAVASEVYDSPFQFALGGYLLSGSQGSDQFGFFWRGQLDRVRLLRAWPGATADTTIWNTLLT
jgi:hypothetical protein